MDRPAKRQKLSDEFIQNEAIRKRESIPRQRRQFIFSQSTQSTTLPTRTLDLDTFQRPVLFGDGSSEVRRRNAGYVIAPRMPDVTVTASAVEIVVNDGSITTQLPAITSETAVTIGSLGTVTIPAITDTTATSSPLTIVSSALSSNSHTGSTSTIVSTPLSLNSTITTASGSSSSDRTATVTATNTLHISYTNGTFILPSTTKQSESSITGGAGRTSRVSTRTGSVSYDDFNPSTTAPYTFGIGVTLTDVSETASSLPTGTGYNNGADATITASSSGSTPTPSNTSAGLPPLTPTQTRVVGGIVGGFAGTALVLVIVLYFLRWYRQHLKSHGKLPEQLAASRSLDHPFDTPGLLASASSMAQTSQTSFLPAAAASLGKWRPRSDVTNATSSTDATVNEKGFQRISGRKLPSVLSHGGDGYGGPPPLISPFSNDSFPASPPPPFSPHYNASQASTYRDSDGPSIYSPSKSQTVTRPPSRSEPTTPTLPFMIDPLTGRPRRPSLHETAYNTSAHDFAASKDLLLIAPRPFSPPSSSSAAAMSRHIDGYATLRDSPARTPITQSPSSSSVRLPVIAPLTMDRDVPDLPLSPTGLMPSHPKGLEPQHLSIPRAPSRLSARSSSTGRFKEDL